ncbi:hypothetical protein C4J98_0159 [Pseudomonas orientalis]|nr:hypothetical protein C4J98_0159 [Pseudomonas orientalis]
MTINNLIEHLDRFVSGSNISVQWAKDTELFWMKLKKMKVLVSLKISLMSCRKSSRFIGLEAASIL